MHAFTSKSGGDLEKNVTICWFVEEGPLAPLQTEASGGICIDYASIWYGVGAGDAVWFLVEHFLLTCFI